MASYSGEDISAIMIGDTVLPVAIESMSISTELRLKETSSAGKSGASKQPLGWDDAQIELSCIAGEPLTDGDLSPRERIAVLTRLFRAQDAKGKPLVYTITNPILTDLRIQYVVITTLKIDPATDSTAIPCSMTLVQHAPEQAKRQRKAQSVSRANAVVRTGDQGPAGETRVDWLGQGTTMMVETKPDLASTGMSTPEMTREQSVADSDPFFEV